MTKKKTTKTNKKIILDSVESHPEKSEKKSFYIVGIGTSAGGLKALQSFFESCPDRSGMAFVVVQHLSPDYKSLMPELLAKHTNMSVAEARDQVQVEPNKVYLIPGRKNISIENSRLVLKNRPPTKQLNFSIDIFLESLAKEMQHQAIGVILSGTGSDGTKGAKAIKEVGGAVFTQTPESSGFDGMPRSVISHNLADFILHPQDMVSEIVQYVKNPQFNYLISGTDLSHKMESIDRILKVVKDNTGIDFLGYKTPTILRRTAKRLNIKKCKSIEEYIDHLYKDKSEADALAQEYLIGVTTFFRDDNVFEYLKSHIIPKIVEEAIDEKRGIKMWTIACSTGEEVYSLAMLIEEYLNIINKRIGYKIYATDIDENAIYKASKGIYSMTDVKGIQVDLLQKYFDKTSEGYKINLRIRQNVIFSKHNVVNNPPFSKMDLVTCRNLLIYFDTDNKTKTMNSIKYSLNPNGYLLLGNSETPGIFDKSFKPINTKVRVYQNKGMSSYMPPELKNWTLDRNIKNKVKGRRKVLTVEEIVNKAFQTKILEEFKSACVCVDESLTIIHAIGKLKRYINIPEDGFSSSLVKILPDNVLIPIQSGIRKLEREKLPEITKNVRIEIEDKQVSLKVLIEQIAITNYFSGTYLITFLEQGNSPIPKGLAKLGSTVSGEEVRMLKESLKETKENLQLTIEELETSNEEMQATNEELLAANEELQSTNEELQSVNEELHTVNAELQEKNTSLIELNSDIENLFKNVQIGTLFLDEENKIRRYTPKLEEHFKFREQDIGREIIHYSGSTILGSDLAKMADEVKESGKMRHIETLHSNGTWYWIEVFPYSDSSKEIRGVTINFINIDEPKKQSEELEKLYHFIEELTFDSPSILSIRDFKLGRSEFILGNPERLIGVTKEEILNGYDMSQLYDEEGKIAVAKHWKKVMSSNAENVVTKVAMYTRDTGEKKWISYSSKIYKRNTQDEPTKCLNVFQDITQIVAKEKKLAASEERYRLALTSQKTGLWECKNIKIGKTWWSDEYKKLLAYPNDSYKKGYQHFLSIIHGEDLENYNNSIETTAENSTAFSCMVRLNIHKKGYRWFEVNGFTEKHKTSNDQRIICSVSLAHGKIVDRLIIESKQKQLQNIFENAPLGIVILNKEGIIQESSIGFSKLIQTEANELTGTKFIELDGRKKQNNASEEFKRLVNYDFPYITFEKKYVLNDGSEKWCHHHLSPINITNSEGVSEVMYCALISDFTDQHRHEEESKQLKHEMFELNKNASKLISTQLTKIESYLDKSRKEDLESKNIEKSVKEIHAYLENLNQHYNLLNTGKSFNNVNLNKLAKSLSSELQNEEIKLNYSVLPGVLAIESQITLLIKELCYSLKNFTKISDNVIELAADGDKEKWVIEVSCVAQRVNRKLVKSSQTYLVKGSGLDENPSLKVTFISCKNIVSNHKGKLELLEIPKEKKLSFRFSIKSGNS